MSTLDKVASCLTTQGYTLVRDQNEIRFEDASILGFAVEFPTIDGLIEGWRDAEERFLREHASELRRDRRKAWNVYSILLTTERASVNKEQSLISIEEDFRATRKVARGGVTTDRDVEEALGVLLPIRQRVSLTSENAFDLLRIRLNRLPSGSLELLLAGGTGSAFAQSLVEAEEAE